jgi:replicative DNA helicase
VLIFSLEDREPKVIDRFFAGISRIPMGTRDTSLKAMRAASNLSALPIHVKDDCPDLRSIEATSRELKARCKIGLIVIDYAQIVKCRVSREVTRAQQIAEISRSFRQLAMELDTPIILLSQLNQDDQTFESRALEQDATACWWIQMPQKDEKDAENVRYIGIPWQRNGPSNIRFRVTFLGAIARVENYAA